MKFIAKTKAVRVDLAKKEIAISFVVDMTDEEMATADELADYVDKDAGQVELTVLPRQERMFKKEKK